MLSYKTYYFGFQRRSFGATVLLMNAALPTLTGSSRKVIETILRHGPSSRAEIAEHTRFTRPAITQIVQELIDSGVLDEQPARRGQRGQPARPLAVRASAACSAGLNFSHSYMDVTLVDLGGAVIDLVSVPLASLDAETIGAIAKMQLDRLMAQHGLAPDRLLGVGISLPGDFDSDGSFLPHAMFPLLRRPDLAASFGTLFDAPVFLENDGRACAIGERVMGAGRTYRSFMLVHLGHGVGGGLIIDGRPFRGALGNAGILGQYYPYGRPRPSAFDLLETLRTAGYAVEDFDGIPAIEHAAAATIAAWITRVAGQLSGDLARISRFLGPEAVIVAGRLPTSIITPLAATIDFPAILRPLDDLPIVPVQASVLGSKAGALGAASLPIFDALLPTG